MSERLRITPLVQENTAWLHARERLWLTDDGERLVPDGHPDAASLFVAAGHRISRSDAERFGLLEDGHDVDDLQAVPAEATAGGLTIEAPDTVQEEQEEQEEQEPLPHAASNRRRTRARK